MGAVDKAKNAMDDAEGKAKEALGRAAGDKSTENEGKADQSIADLKQAGEKAKDAFKH
ncbi:MAG TPA: CsbD family protein [Jatrophihabitantaceae bacterium]|nr:CsbD family protein [Jatrophihabitantaceae bacterium]